MSQRTEKLILLTALGLLMAAPGCGPDDGTEDEDVLDGAESEASLRGDFQKGVAPSASYAGVTDATLRESTPTTNDGSGVSVAADFDDPAGTRKRTNGLIKFDIGSIPVGSKVTSVSFTVNVTNRTSGSGYALYALSRAWTESQTTWQAAAGGSAWSLAGARGSSDRSSTAIGTLVPTATGKATVTLNAAGIAVVQNWVNTPSKNFGFIIDTDDNADGVAFDSSNATTASNRPKLSVAYTTPPPPAPVASPYPVYTKAEVEAWSTSNPEYSRLAGSWAGNVNRAYGALGTRIDTSELEIVNSESVYVKTQAVLWATDGNAARKAKVEALLKDYGGVTSYQWDSVEQYRLVAGWIITNLAQAAAIVGYKDANFTRFLKTISYPIMDWNGANNWQASFADSKLATAVYLNDAALYADAKKYFYAHVPRTIYHASYDGNKVVPILKADGSVDTGATVRAWGGYFGVPQIKSDLTFIDPSYVTNGFDTETIRDPGHVGMGLGAFMHAARTIRAHGDTLDKSVYDRLRAGYALHAKRVLTFKTTQVLLAPAPTKGTGGGDQGWFGARKLFGSDTPADVVSMCNHHDVTTFAPAGANHLVDEAFADGQ